MKSYSHKKLTAIFALDLGGEVFSMISVKLCHFPSLSAHRISSMADNNRSSGMLKLLLWGIKT